MAEREFTITELKRAGDGGYVDSLVKFTWTNTTRSAPRGSWDFGVEQRSVREDYPGATQPVEQVLGPNYTDFTLQGCWDDRYNEEGFAVDTMRRFEQLAQRGNLCRFEFESVSITGLIKNVNFSYRRASYIHYSFTVSPHYRNARDLPTASATDKSERFKPITQYRDEAFLARTEMEEAKEFAPVTQMSGLAFQNHNGLLDRMEVRVNQLIDAIDQRLDSTTEVFKDIKRVSNLMNILKGEAFSVMVSMASYKSDAQLSWETAVASLNFDTWRTSTTALARKLGLLGAEGSAELDRRVEPKAVALYRPRKGESLYSISQRFYGTPNGWQAIATRNGLTTTMLQGTELLIIPDRR